MSAAVCWSMVEQLPLANVTPPPLPVVGVGVAVGVGVGVGLLAGAVEPASPLGTPDPIPVPVPEAAAEHALRPRVVVSSVTAKTWRRFISGTSWDGLGGAYPEHTRDAPCVAPGETLAGRDSAGPAGEQHAYELRPAAYAELAVDPPQVELHGLPREEQAGGDLLVRHPGSSSARASSRCPSRRFIAPANSSTLARQKTYACPSRRRASVAVSSASPSESGPRAQRTSISAARHSRRASAPPRRSSRSSRSAASPLRPARARATAASKYSGWDAATRSAATNWLSASAGGTIRAASPTDSVATSWLQSASATRYGLSSA